jgi:hypothetical protein
MINGTKSAIPDSGFAQFPDQVKRPVMDGAAM